MSSAWHGTAGEQVDAAKSLQKGANIIENMNGNIASQNRPTFKRINQVVTLASKTNKETNQAAVIQPELLFQRYVTASRSLDSTDLFNFELCGYPPLFQFPGMLRQPNKALLADAIWRANS